MARAKVELIALKNLVLHPTLQPRPGHELTDPSHVEDLRRSIRDKAKLPRPKVYRVPDAKDGSPHGLLVWDGFHTVTAHLAEHPSAKIECDVTDGTYADAYLATGGTNHHATAGLKRDNLAKRHSVARTIRGLAKKGERRPMAWIAEYCRVSDTLVKTVMGELAAETALLDGTTPEKDIETPPEPVFATRKNGVRQRVKATPSTNGKEVKAAFDWKPFEAAMGVVQRAPDDAAKVTPELKATTEYRGVTKLLGELAEVFAVFKKLARTKQEK